MSDDDAIRKKHLADTAFRPLNRDALTSSLTISEVDALFEALDEARDVIRQAVEWVQDGGEDASDLLDILLPKKGGRG